MEKVTISECGRFFEDRDGLMRFRVEWEAENQSGVEYMATLSAVERFEAIAHQSFPDGEPCQLRIETPETYEQRRAAYLSSKVSRKRRKEAEEALAVARHLLESIKKTASREF